MLRTVAQQLYLAYFGRPADSEGLGNFTFQLEQFLPTTANIGNLAQVYDNDSRAVNLVNGFSISQESRDLYTGLTPQFVDSIYRNILNRPSEEEGRLFWVDAIDNRGLDPAKAALEIISAALRNGVRDADTVLRKTEVAQAFTDALDTPDEMRAFSGNDAAAAARNMLSQVDAETDVQAFQAQIEQVIAELKNTTDLHGATQAEATAVTLGSTTNALFNNGNGTAVDTDLFRFTGQAEELFEVFISSSVANSFRLLNSVGGVLATSSFSSGTQGSRILKFAPETAGDLFFEFNSSISGNNAYSFQLVKSADDFADSFFGAARLENATVKTGISASSADTDAFRFAAQSGKRYFVELDSLPATPGLKTNLEVYGSNLVLQKQVGNPGVVGGESTTRVATVVEINQAGDHFLYVENTNNTNNGQYNIQVTEITQVDQTGDTFGTAKQLSLNTQSLENIDSRFDQDTFRISLQAGTTYTADLGINAPAMGLSLSVNLYNAQGTLVNPNLILATGSFSRNFQIQTSGDYFIQINDLNYDALGQYSFAVNGEAAPPPDPTPQPVSDPFDIDFIYQNGTEAFASFFDQVETRLKRVIVEGLPDFTNFGGQTIDDLQIVVTQQAIIQPNVLAFAGPTGIRSGFNGLPYAGEVTIDSAEAQSMINSGAFFDVMLHEVLHVLGAGTLWQGRGLINNSGYVGQNAVEEYRLLTGNSNETFVPLSDDGHWSESIFGNEVLTPSINFSSDVIFSRLSIASLEDLGYAVDYTQADPFVLPMGVRSAEFDQEAGYIA